MLGVEGVDVTQPLSFTDLGGDSLGATAFSALLHEIFGVSLPVNAILSPAGNPKKWARIIEDALSKERARNRPSPASTERTQARSAPSTWMSQNSSMPRRWRKCRPRRRPKCRARC